MDLTPPKGNCTDPYHLALSDTSSCEELSSSNCSCTGYCKDDNIFGTQIGFCLLIIYTIYLLSINVKSLLLLKEYRKKIKIYKLLSINVVMFFFLIFNLILFIDGVVALFNGYGYLGFKTFNILEEFTPFSQQVSFAIGYYNWSFLFSNVYDKPRQTVRRIALTVSGFFVLLFTGLYIFFVVFFNEIDTDTNQLFFTNQHGYDAAITVLCFGIFFNTSLFVIACYILIQKLSMIYYFSNEKSARKMRNLLVCTIVAASLRIVLDVLLTFLPDFYGLTCRIYAFGDYGAPSDRIIWSLYTFFFFMVCNLFPINFLLIHFSPVMTKTKPNLQSHSSDNAVADDLNGALNRDNRTEVLSS